MKPSTTDLDHNTEPAVETSPMTLLQRDQTRLRKQISFFLACLVAALVMIVALTYATSQMVRVGGPSYTFIIEKKDLIADVLPPPGYIVESYQLVFELVDEDDETVRGELEERLFALEEDYEHMHDRWSAKLSDAALKQAVLVEAHEPAKEFFLTVRNEFLPAILARDKVGARKIATGRMRASFDRHRRAVDRAVVLAQDATLTAERDAARLIEQRTAVLLVLGATVGLILLGIGGLVGRRILRDGQLLTQALAERRRVEENLRASETLRRQVLTREGDFKSALLLSIAHDLRAPISSIGATASLMTDAETRRERSAQLEIIEKHSREMLQLVDNLFEMLRLQGGALEVKREVQYIDEVIEAALQRSKHTHAGRHVDVRLATDLPPVNCDDVLLLVVLSNLIDNAVKYSPDGSTITLTAHRVDHQIDIALTNEMLGEGPVSWDEMFLPFRRNPPSMKGKIRGTGLGLTICRGIMDMHGGSIAIESQPDGKIRALVSLPVQVSEVRTITGCGSSREDAA